MNKAIIDYSDLLQSLEQTPLAPWLQVLPAQIEQGLSPQRYGDVPGWLEVLAQLPETKPSVINLNQACLQIGSASDIDDATRSKIESLLQQLHPWRKGPFNVHGIHIDTEWRSDWKWDRLANHIQPLKDRWVLDVGCGSGYHCWRMWGAGARQVIGVDPSPRFVMQYWAMRHFIGATQAKVPVHVLPMPLEGVPEGLEAFDTVFSMGVLYHRRDPQEHLQQLMGCLRPGGELVMETLVIQSGIESDTKEALVPEGRYAKMRNVWAIPSCDTLAKWLDKAGFQNIRLVDVTRTSVEEQRRTEWMRFESLADFLDPEDSTKTVEGHPVPTRAIFTAEKP